MSLLADITVSRTYAQVKQDGTKENWEEIVNRYLQMLSEDFPQFRERITHYGKLIHEKKILPSMRMLQFAGEAIRKDNARGYNCSAVNITSTKDIADLFYLLMCGTGVGYSVQRHHIEQLHQELVHSKIDMDTYVIPDSREGWADSVRYLLLNPHITFDYGLIRPAGAKVSSGGTASGPDSLRHAHEQIRKVLYRGNWPLLKPIDVHDICCHIADVVVVGGVRRSAMICIFDKDDVEMQTCKSGEWWKDNPQRARANNSAMLLRGTVSQEEFNALLDTTFNSYAGEPGIFWSGSKEVLTNPCFRAGTLIHTNAGLQRIETLIGKTIQVFDGNEWVTCSNFRVTGTNQEVLRITLHDGSTIEVTPNHSVILADGTRKYASHIEPGDYLKISSVSTQFGNQDVPDAYLKGFLLAEGTRAKARDVTAALLHLYEPKYCCYKRLVQQGLPVKPLKEKRTSFYLPQQLKVWAWDYKKELPAEVFTWNKESIIQLLTGIFDGDGTAADTKNGFMYQLTSVNAVFLKQVQLLLKMLGVHSVFRLVRKKAMKDFNDGYGEYETKDCYRLTLNQQAAIKLAQLCNFERLVNFGQKNTVYDLKTKWNKVVKIESIGIEKEVYCCTVPSTNSIAIGNGIQIGQCSEISLNSNQFCNLTTINFSTVLSVDDFAMRAKAATLFGTLQAAYTKFNYISDSWTTTTRRECLLGVSITGIGDNWKCFESMALSGDVASVAYATKKWNYEFATELGIEPAARITTLKPEGTTSVVLDTTSGMHAAHSEYYIRRVRLGRTTELGRYLESKLAGTPFWEVDQFNEANGIIALPVAMPGSRTRSQETAIQQLERMKLIKDCWIDPGHRYGINTHNVSITVYYREDEREDLKRWMWENRYSYAGISLLPYDGGTYVQAPFEEISQETYRELKKQLDSIAPSINLAEVRYNVDTEQKAQLEVIACGGGSCELK